MLRGTINSNQDMDFRRRIFIFSGIPIIIFLAIIAVLFSLQIVKGPQYAQKAKSNREQFSILPAIRGVVYDRTGRNVLAYNRRSFAVSVVPQNLPKNETERQKLLSRLGILLTMSPDEITSVLSQKDYSQYGSYVIKTDVPFKDIVFLAEHNRDFPGVYWKSKPLRVYPNGDMLAHVIGYVGMISQREYLELSERGYNVESVIGKSGVEKVYDLELKGRDGHVRRIVDATNQVSAEIVDKGAEPVPGNNVILTVDLELQRIAEKAFGDHTGALVVSKPATGEILAFVSSPRFDPNFFVSGRDPEDFKKLTLDPGKPFLNRVIQAQYPAGSIFKLVVSLAILDSGMVPVDKEYVCGGGYQLGNRFFSCWTNHGGRINLHKAIVNSCDSYFYQTSLVLGPDLIAEYARNLGLGRALGIDLIGELEGIIPDIHWKREVKKDVWYEGDTLNLSIGQGFVLVTPLQLNALTNIIANRGVLMKPHLIREIRSARTNAVLYQQTPEALIQSDIDPKYFDFVADAMRGVVTEGTARWGGAVFSADAAGKTSSSEIQGMITHSWYTSFAPYDADDPEDIISVTAIVEYGGAGSVAAAPIVSEVIEAYFSGADLDTVRRNIWKKRMSMSRKTADTSTAAASGTPQSSDTASEGNSGTEPAGRSGGELEGRSGTGPAGGGDAIQATSDGRSDTIPEIPAGGTAGGSDKVPAPAPGGSSTTSQLPIGSNGGVSGGDKDVEGVPVPEGSSEPGSEGNSGTDR
jgi:penicillin-binding protein 2